jgi:hypothetical protein
MKITIDFDATPDEARRFFGLPGIAPMQEALGSMDPEQMWRQWMPVAGAGIGGAVADIPRGMDAMRQFWEQAMRTAMTGGKSNDK